MEPTAQTGFSRRGFLKIGLLSGVVLASGSALAMAGSSDRYRPLLPPGADSAPPEVLSEKELAILAVLADCVVPDEDGYLSARAAQIARRIDLELRFHSRKMRSDVKAALMLIEHGGLLHGRFRRFTSLSVHDQEEALERMAVSRLGLERQALNGLKLMILFMYYTDERTWASIHYQGPLVQVRKVPEASNLVP